MTKHCHLTLSLILAFSLSAAAQTITSPDTIRICLGDTVRLEADVSGAFSWEPAAGFIDPVTVANPRVVPPVSRYYRLTTSAGPQDSVYVDVDRFVVPRLIDDGMYCQGAIQLIQTPVTDAGDTRYTFAPGEGFLDDSTDVNSIYTGNADTVFTLISMVENGACADTQSVRIDVIESVLDIQQDSVLVCRGEGAMQISVAVLPFADEDVVWTPTRGIVGSNTGETITVEPINDITYFARANVNGCPQVDSVVVRLDSLPEDLSMMLDPAKDPYCQGDTFNVRSPIYDVGDFPLIEHQWIVAPGLQSPRELYNGVFQAVDSALLTRVTTNGGCVDTNFLQVNVIQPPIPIFNPPNPVVCPGEPLQIMVTFDPSGPTGTLEWMDPSGTLSCTDCLTPTATVSTPTEYTIEITADGSECTSPSMYFIDVVTDVNPTLIPNTTICQGDGTPIVTGNVFPDYTYRITGGGTDTNDPNTVVFPDETTTYTVEATGPCGNSTQQVTVTVIESTATVTIDGPDVVRQGQTLTLTANTDPEDFDGQFIWTLPDGTTLNGRTINVISPQSGDYTVAISNGGQCPAATDVIAVSVVQSAAIYPEVITPNGDGTNDSFRLFFSGTVSDYSLTVWNRWGQKVFETEDPSDGWDGSIDGTPQSQDVFLYYATFNQDGADLEVGGQFTLVR